MTNQQRMQSTPIIETFDKISMGTDECLLRVLSGIDGDERREYHKEYKNCRACLEAWLNEEER